MAKIPDIGPRPTPRFGGGVVNLPASGQAEAQAISQLGQSIAGFGEVMAKAKIQDDRFQVEDATTRLQQKRLELSKGENGFVHTKAGDITDKFSPEYMGRFDAARKEIEDSLGNSEQKQMFARRADVTRIGYNEDLINHVTKERDIFNHQVYTGGVSTELDIAASEYFNENEVKRSLLRTEKLTDAEAERLGIKGDAKKFLLKQNQSNIHEAVIRNAIDDGNNSYARTWFEKNQKNIVGDKQDDIRKLLKASGIREDSQAAVDDYMARGLDQKEALKEARKLPADLRDVTVQRVEQRYAEAAQILDQNQKDAGETAWSIFADTGDVDKIPTSVLETMDGKERIALESTAAKIASGTEVKTDFATYYGLRQMATEDPAAFKKENLLKYADKLSPADRKELVKLQTDDKGITIARTKSQILSQGAASIGLDPKEASKDGGAGDKVRAYYKRVDDEVEAFQLDTGKVPTPKDIQDITDRLSIEVIRDPGGLLGTGFFEGERPVAKADIPGVPSNLIDELAASLQKRNIPVTDENIKILYRATLR